MEGLPTVLSAPTTERTAPQRSKCVYDPIKIDRLLNQLDTTTGFVKNPNALFRDGLTAMSIACRNDRRQIVRPRFMREVIFQLESMLNQFPVNRRREEGRIMQGSLDGYSTDPCLRDDPELLESCHKMIASFRS